jgi:TPR repeat protein
MAQVQCVVASMYHLGLGISIDGAEALKWYHRAAEQGYAVAYNNLGSLYRTGSPGVPVDREKARECYRRAVECGFSMIPKDWYE